MNKGGGREKDVNIERYIELYERKDGRTDQIDKQTKKKKIKKRLKTR